MADYFTPAIFRWPYTNEHELNLQWVIDEIKSTLEKIQLLSQKVDSQTGEAQKYTDQKISELRTEIGATLTNFNNTLQQQYSTFANSVNTSLSQMDQEIASFDQKIDSKIAATNARTDLLLKQTTENILQQLSTGLLDIRVVNSFNGELVTIQSMFDTLADFHLSNSITFDNLAEKDITYDHYAGLNITFIELVNNGANVVN